MVSDIIIEDNQNEARKRDRTRSDNSDTKSVRDIHSPEAKKGRINEQEVMETVDLIDKDLAVVYSTTIVSKLEIDTNNVKIKDLINCYNPVLCGDFDLMKRHMFDASEGWKDKEEMYKSAIMYVLNDGKECEENDIDNLAETLLAAIENRMPKSCKDCKLWYIIDREDRPTTFCTWCRVGKHDCNQIKDIEEHIHGLKWFCGKCDELFTSQIQPKMRKFKNIHFEGFDESDEIINLQTVTNKKENEEDLNSEEIIEIKVVDDKEKKNTPKNTEKEDETVERKPEDNKNEAKVTDAKKACWFWTNRKCKFGTKCKDEHPEQCKVMMETGKCEDSRCKLSHPKICRGMYYEGYCSRRNCWYIHPKNIVNRYVFMKNTNTYNNNNNNTSHRPNAKMNSSQTGWPQGNPNQNVQWNPNNNQWSQPNNRNTPPFLDQWPTPWEASRSTKMLISKIFEEVTSKIMSL